MTHRMSYSYNEEQKAALMHYGVLGMKWGVRKERELKGRKPAKAEKPKSKRPTDLNASLLCPSFIVPPPFREYFCNDNQPPSATFEP